MFDLHTLCLLLIFIAAGLVKGVTGMGLPTVAMGLLGLLMPPQAAAALLVLPSLLTNLWQLLAGPALAQIARRLVNDDRDDYRHAGGSSLLIHLNPRWSALALGAVLIAYAGYALRGPAVQVFSPHGKAPVAAHGRADRRYHRGDRGICYSGRSLATGAGLSSRRAGAGPGVVVHPFHSGDGGRPLSARWLARRFAAAVGAGAVARALLGMWLGQRIRSRLSPQRFRQGFLLFLLALGLELVLRGCWRNHPGGG